MAVKRVTQNSAILYNDANIATSVLLVGQTSVDKKITFPLIKKYVILNKTIGGAAAGDIVTTNNAQNLTNKTLTGPFINGGTALAATSDLIDILANLDTTHNELNLLAGLTADSTHLNRTSDLTSNAQAQINLKTTRYGTSEPYSLYYTVQKALSGTTSTTVVYTDILSAYSLSTTLYRVGAKSLIVQVYEVNTGNQTRTLASPTISFTSTTNGSNIDLNTITLGSLNDGKTYDINIMFHLNQYSGGA